MTQGLSRKGATPKRAMTPYMMSEETEPPTGIAVTKPKPTASRNR
jgi:hypothetical protein